MKKLFSILFAGLIALMATACFPEENFATFDASKATAPVIGSYEMGAKALSIAYTPGKFNAGFNDKMAVNHMVVLTAIDGKTVNKVISSTNKDNVLTVSVSALSNLFLSMGYQEGQTVSFDAIVRATMQNPAQDNGRNGHVDSKDKVSITGFEIVIQKGSPYIDYTEDSDWSVIGSLSAYEISWDKDLQMWTDGAGNHVAAHVQLFAGDEFKFRKDQAWTVNMGGDFGSLDNVFTVTQDGSNIKVGADGYYDLFVNPDAGTAWISEAFDPYPDYTEASNWSVIGSLSKHGISWDGDLPMITDGTWHVALGVNLAAADEFKFRQDASWTVNMGGEFGGLDSEFTVTQDGSNIVVGVEGTYDLFVNPGAGLAKVSETTGAKVSGIIGGDDPGPGPEPVKGWNIIGLNGDWENDVIATQNGNVWTAYVTANESTEFKWRKDGGWDENYGGVMVALGEPFEAVAGGDNIKVDAGFWKVVLDTEALTITVSEGSVWSLIGVNGDWEHDIDMVLDEGVWVSPETAISGEFKLRYNHGWDNNRGGTMESLGVEFDAVPGGANINVPEGTYVVFYYPESEKIIVANAKKIWSVIGVNGDWNTDYPMTEIMPGVWMSDLIEVTSGDWKVRFDYGWDVNRGGNTPESFQVGNFIAAVPGGQNIALTGTFKVVYNANNETIGTLGWGVIGTINGWSGDVPMNLASDGKWYSVPVTLAETDEIKIRWDADWGVNRGGTMTAVGEPFAVENNGDNIKNVPAGTYMLVYDPSAEQITLTKAYWGIVGAFNGWGNDPDIFLMFDGANWVAYNQSIAGDWKIRQASDWAVNRGGSFVETNVAFDAVDGGSNINVGDLTGYAVVYDPANEKITIVK